MKFLLSPLALALCATPAAAQIDYRNLDQGRPTLVEDAYPLERYGFELSAQYRHLGRSPERFHLLAPEIGYGFASGVHATVRLPFVIPAGRASGAGGLAGADLSVLYNLSTERTRLPGLALRADASLPIGAASGRGAGIAMSALATRSFGAQRLHLNASVALNSPRASSSADPLPRWWLGAALDHTLLRSSTLLVAEATVGSPGRGVPLRYTVGAGLRRQLTPTLVLNFGLGVELARHSYGEAILSAGISRAFAIGFLMPGGSR